MAWRSGSIYALVALGLLLIFNTVQIVNFAQGQLLMLGAFIGISCAVTHELPVAAAWAITMVAMALVGVVFMVLVYFPLRGRPAFLVILTTIAMGIVLENLALIVWGPLPVSLPSPIHGPPLRFAGVVVSMHQLFIFATLAVILLLQFFFLTKTRFGILMQATAAGPRTPRGWSAFPSTAPLRLLSPSVLSCRGSPGSWWRRFSSPSRPWGEVSV